MDVADRVELRLELPSRNRPEVTHRPGTPGFVVEHLGDDAFIVEFRIPDTTLVGDAWYETFAMREDELKPKV